MNKIAESVQLLFNVECQVKFEEGYPPTMNSPKLRESVERALEGANFDEKVLIDVANYYEQLLRNYKEV